MILNKNLVSLFKQKLLRDAGLYTLFRIVDKIIPFLLLPIITRALTPDEFGIFVLFQALAGIALPIMTLSVDSSILLNYFKVKADRFRNYFSSGYLLLILSSIVVSQLIWVLTKPISDLTEFPVDWIGTILLFCFFQFHSNLALNLYQVKKEVYKFGLYSISLTLTKNILMLILVINVGMKWEGIIVSYVIAYGVFFCISLWLFKLNDLYTLKIDKSYLVDNIKVGYPLSLHTIGTWLGNSATRVIVSGLLGTAATGSFGVGAALAMLVLYIQDSFNKAFVPYLFEKLESYNQEIGRKLVKLTYIYNTVIFIFALFVGIAGYFLIDIIFGVDYIDGREVVIFIALAYAFDGMYKMHVNYIFFEKKTHLIFFITMFTGILNIGLTYFLVLHIGLAGAGIAFFIVSIIGYLISWYIAQKVFPMNWSLKLNYK
jgi:O-antigen/teichoic acid export membrane protein